MYFHQSLFNCCHYKGRHEVNAFTQIVVYSVKTLTEILNYIKLNGTCAWVSLEEMLAST